MVVERTASFIVHHPLEGRYYCQSHFTVEETEA